MPSRQQAVDPGLDPKRRAAALRTTVAFAAFRARLELPETSEALLLYLTHLQATGSSGHMLQRRLQQLNAARRMEGNEAWTADPDVRLLLRGLHQVAPLTTKARGHPLYRELVMAMVDATMSPTFDQRRWRTALLLANETGASLLSISSLQWADVHFRGDSLSLRWAGAGAYQQGYGRLVTRVGAPRVFEAMHDLWANTHDRSGEVFASRLGFCDYQNVIRRCGALPKFSRSTRSRPRLSDAELDAVLGEAVGPTLKQLRDRALILVGHSAALRTSEATDGHRRLVPRRLARPPARRPPTPRGDRCSGEQWRLLPGHRVE